MTGVSAVVKAVLSESSERRAKRIAAARSEEADEGAQGRMISNKTALITANLSKRHRGLSPRITNLLESRISDICNYISRKMWKIPSQPICVSRCLNCLNLLSCALFGSAAATESIERAEAEEDDEAELLGLLIDFTNRMVKNGGAAFAAVFHAQLAEQITHYLTHESASQVRVRASDRAAIFFFAFVFFL
jgi:hypothetical protein